jgi:hypothetical protein
MTDLDDFEREARRLLGDRTDALSGHVRSRLTQARHAALASVGQRRSSWRSWMPAGAVAALALVMWVSFRPSAEVAHVVTLESAAGLEDVELLTDDEAFDLAQERDIAQEQDVGADFYEWAVDEAQGSGQIVGT